MANLGSLLNVGTSTVNNVVKPLVSLALLVAIYIVVSKALKAYKLRGVGKSTYNPNNINPNINYDNLCAAIHKSDEAGVWIWRDTDGLEKTAGQLMSYNDDELKYIYSRYDSLFGKAGDDRTLYDVFDFFCLGCSNAKALLKRFERLSLN